MVKVSFKSSVYKKTLPFLVFIFPVNLIVSSGSTAIMKKIVKEWHNKLKIFRKLPKVMLLCPAPVIGKIRTRPEIVYGPTKVNDFPLKTSSYFPSGFSWNPLKWFRRINIRHFHLYFRL